MKNEERGVIGDRIFKIGITLAIGLIVIGGSFEIVQYLGRKINFQSVKPPVKLQLPICEGTKNTQLSSRGNSARQFQNWNCLSGLVILPSDLEMGRLRYSFPGTTEIYECQKGNEQDCFLIREITAKDAGKPVIFPTRIRLRGDLGETRFKLVD